VHFFSIGFSAVFIVIALATTQLSQYFLDNSEIATRIGGFLLIIFALVLFLSHVTDIRFFSMENRPLLKSRVTDSGAVATGAAFAFGWSPCIGPILGGVLAYASTQHSLTARIATILFYCIGLCLTMSLIVYSSFRYQRFAKFLQRNLNVFTWIAILTMAFFGFVLFFNQLTWITSELTRFLDTIGLDGLVTIG
jgi:cytochrome c-type biogenesis protein